MDNLEDFIKLVSNILNDYLILVLVRENGIVRIRIEENFRYFFCFV